ncbi:Os12g0564400, partial [Oryza sativa Japonica Group]
SLLLHCSGHGHRRRHGRRTAPSLPPRAARRFPAREALLPLCHPHRRNVLSTMLSTSTVFLFGPKQITLAETTGGTFREYIDTFDGYSFLYPKSWIQVRGAGADIFFRDPFFLDENMSVEISSPSSSKYMTVEDLGPPEKAAERVLQQYLTEFMSTRLGVRRTSNILSASSKVADDGKLYYEVEVNQTDYTNSHS